jgi:tetratricopeptide (TPR) repeat protein
MAMGLCCFVPMLNAQQQTGSPPPTAKPVKEAPTPPTPAESEMTVEDAIRLAINALDRVEAGAATEELQPIPEEASRLIELVRTKDPNNAWLAFLHGRFYAFTGRRAEAVEHLRRFVETREGRNEWRAHRLLGDMFVEEYPRLAEASYQRAATLNPGEASILFGLSRSAFKLGDAEQAIELARRAVAADGRKNVRYVAHLATLLKAAGRLSEAAEEVESSVALARKLMSERPGSRFALLVADAQYRLLVEIMQARVSEPGHTVAQDYLRLATYMRERAQITEMLVLHDVLRVIEMGVEKTAPDTPPGLLEQYGITLSEVGRTEQAIAVFEKLLEADPNNTVAQSWLRRLRPEPAGSDTQTPEP